MNNNVNINVNNNVSNEQKFENWIADSNNIVFFGGAGVSTESGIPDFRSVDGLYHQKYDFPPETILSHSFFQFDPDKFYEFYRDKMLYLDAKPNVTHEKLSKLEFDGKLKTIITQNIDGLHQIAGSNHVLELHGSVHRNYCMTCKKSYGVEFIVESKDIPRCDCGGIIKPDVVLYEEPLNDVLMKESAMAIESADLLIIGGTSLSVYPAAGLVQHYKGDRLVLINKSTTPYDQYANLLLHCSLGEIFSLL